MKKNLPRLPFEIQLHALTLPALLILWLFGGLSSYLPMFVSIALHEAAHLICVLLLRESPRRVLITPWGCMLELDSAPDKKNAVPIYLSGCAASFLLAFITPWRSVNIALGIFNLFPVLPLDGGKVVYTLLGYRAAAVLGALWLLALCIMCASLAAPPLFPVMVSALLVFPCEERELHEMRKCVKNNVEKNCR
ncbi:MAG: site-2 protease family protein [Clostridia bacterium]|nr:site-2 protease family protein [Clostridia bacterium]